MAGPADAQELEVQPPEGADFLFVGEAVAGNFLHRQRPVRDVDVVHVDVHVVEEVLLHEGHVALGRLRVHGVILIQVERHHVLEAQPLFLVQPNQFGVNADRRHPGGQAQNRFLSPILLRADKVGDPAGHFFGGGFLVREHGDRQLFKPGFF